MQRSSAKFAKRVMPGARLGANDLLGVPTIMENQREKIMENEMEAGVT